MRLKIEPEGKSLHWISDIEIRLKLEKAKRLENLAIAQQRALNALKKEKDMLHLNPENVAYAERVLARLDELDGFMERLEKSMGI